MENKNTVDANKKQIAKLKRFVNRFRGGALISVNIKKIYHIHSVENEKFFVPLQQFTIACAHAYRKKRNMCQKIQL